MTQYKITKHKQTQTTQNNNRIDIYATHTRHQTHNKLPMYI